MLQLLWLGLALGVYLIILKPLIPILRIKYKLGNKAAVMYFPIIGSYFYLMRSARTNSVLKYYMEFSKQNPQVKVVLSNLFFSEYIMLIDPTYYKEFLQNHHRYQTINIFSNDEVWNGGLIASTGEEWSRKRKKLSPYFSFEELKSRLPTLNKAIVDRLDADFADTPPNGKVLDLYNFAIELTGEILIRTFFSNQFTPIDGQTPSLFITQIFQDLTYNALNNAWFGLRYALLGQRAWHVMASPFQVSIRERLGRIRKQATTIVQERVALKLQQRKQNIPYERKDFIDQVINQSMDSDELDMDFILQSFIGFFQAGTDTTAHLIVAMIVALAEHPEIQERICKEIEEHPDINDVHALAGLKLTHAFMQEAHRIYNPVVMLIPRKVLVPHQICDIPISKGAYINCYLQFTLTNPNWYPNPACFDLERWIKSPCDQQFTNITFSGGPRNCLGQHLAQAEAKLTIVHLLRRFTLHRNGSEPLAMTLGSLMQFDRNNLVRFVPRQ